MADRLWRPMRVAAVRSQPGDRLLDILLWRTAEGIQTPADARACPSCGGENFDLARLCQACGSPNMVGPFNETRGTVIVTPLQ
jgi:hypothetical protein